MNYPISELRLFHKALSQCTTRDEAHAALWQLSASLVGAKLFTIMTLDMDAGLARRAFTSDPGSYPATGTKPIERNSWFEIVHGKKQSFVANTITEIAEVFGDYELIESLGCGSVVNLPVVIAGELVATINLLHETGYYTAERCQVIEDFLSGPALATLAICNTAHFVDSRSENAL